MDRRARLAGIDFAFKKDDDGIHFSIKTDPEHRQAQQEVYDMLDQVRIAARRAGVSDPELMAYWAKSRVKGWGKKQ
ncbi:MAG: hypothetical protein ACYCOU_09710 [Sulfobacillus sp.]